MKQYAAVRAIATYLPEMIEKNDQENHLIQKLGIKERHIADAGQSAGDLAILAAEKLFKEYEIEKASIDFVLLCTQPPDYLRPTTACYVQAKLGLSKRVGALDYSLGCSGYVYGLSLAKGMIESGLVRNVLLLTSSVYTKYINKQDMVTRPLFGDGASATLVAAVEREDPFLQGFVFGTDGEGYDKLIIPVGGSRNMPRETPEIFEKDDRGNVRSNYEMHMDGTAITFFSMRTVPSLVEAVLEKAGCTREELDGCVFHQANRYLLEKLRQRCRLEDVPFYNDIEHIGNTVSGTIPFALDDLLRQERLHDGHRILIAGFGVGLSWAGCIADFSACFKKYDK